MEDQNTAFARLVVARDITDLDGARAFLRDCCVGIGGGFHPDTPGADYVRGDGLGGRSFSDDDATTFDENLAKTTLICDDAGTDVYELTQEVEASRFLPITIANEQNSFLARIATDDDVANEYCPRGTIVIEWHGATYDDWDLVSTLDPGTDETTVRAFLAKQVAQ